MGDRMVVVAAHLDDAVLSVGEAIAVHPEPTVITVFCGRPAHDTGVTDYDRSCGFSDSADAMVARQAEHRLALGTLGATGVNLTSLDRQYRGDLLDRNALADVATQLVSLITGISPAVLLVPLGITHPDHLQLASICRSVLMALDVAEIGVYEDLPYRVLDPMAALESWRSWLGLFELMPLGNSESLGPKLLAISCYSSQISENIERCARVPERIWRYR